MARSGAGRVRRLAERARELAARGQRSFDAAVERSPWFAVSVDVFRRDRQIGGTLLAAALAFRIFIWLLPCALLLCALLGFAPTGEGSAGDIARQAGLTPLTTSLLEQVAGQARGGRYVTAIVGLVLLALAGGALARALDGVRVRVWGPFERRGVRPALLRAGLYSGLLLAVILAYAGVGVLRAYTGTPDVLVSVLAVAVVVVIGLLMLAPGLPHWRVALPGAVAFAVGVEALRLVSTYYLPGRFERATELYGAIGVAAAVLVWLTLMARLVVFGHVVNEVLWSRGQQVDRPDPALAAARLAAVTTSGSASTASSAMGSSAPGSPSSPSTR